jgi:hypothetical protein
VTVAVVAEREATQARREMESGRGAQAVCLGVGVGTQAWERGEGSLSVAQRLSVMSFLSEARGVLFAVIFVLSYSV